MSLSGIDDYFRKKLWALMHDPPNKAWIMINGKDHVSETMRIYDEAFKGTGIKAFTGGAPPYNDQNNPDIKLVNEADRLASSFDRWAFIKPGPSRYVVRNTQLLNIFNPEKTYELTWDQEFEKKVNDYIGKLNETLKNLDEKIKGNPRAVYNLLYAIYESAWINLDLPPSPADTRAPTHDVFDHDYATAMIMNWLMHGKFTGYYAVGDIPGVQTFITSSRRAGDLWASSWTLSMVIWLTIWPLVWKYGPDILIRPTARLNPLYAIFMVTALDMLREGKDPGNTDSMCELLEKAITQNIGEVKLAIELLTPISKLPTTSMIIQTDPLKAIQRILSIAFIGESFQLALPPKTPEGTDVTKDEIINEVINNFKKATECIVNTAKKHIPNDYNYEYVIKLINHLINKKNIELRLPLRIAVLNINEVYESYRNKCPLDSKVIQELGITDETCPDILFFDYLMTSDDIMKMIHEEESRRIPTIGSWFDEEGKPLFNKEYDDKLSGGWVPSTLNPEVPAVVKFGKDIINNVLCYDEKTTDWLTRDVGLPQTQTKHVCENSGDPRIRVLMSVFKPGEALSPIDLAKRLIHLGLKRDLDVAFESTDDVAAMYLGKLEGADEIYGRGDCKNIIWNGYINFKGGPRDVDNICIEGRCGDPEQIRTYTSTCVERGIKGSQDLVDKVAKELTDNDVVDDICDKLGSDDLRNTCRTNIVKELLNFHSTYAIIRGDGDSLGEIHRGNIPNHYNALRKFYEQLNKDADKLVSGDVDEFKADLDRQLRIINALENAMQGRIPVSPAYKFAITRSLMVTAMKVLAMSINDAMPIYLGGDDLLILAPIETTLKVVENARKVYWAMDGEKPFFHKLGNYVIPALAAYGQSYSVRFTHLFDIFSEEYQTTGELLEHEAKGASWGLFEKDSITISHSRTSTTITLPVRPSMEGAHGISAIMDLRRAWTALLGNLISSNLPEDLDKYREVFTKKYGGKTDMETDIVKEITITIILRNTKNLRENEARDLIINELLKHSNQYGDYGAKYILNIISGIKILRRLP